jgi:hypothetical protein
VGGVPRVPSAVDFSAPTAPRLSGPPSYKNPATPLQQSGLVACNAVLEV